MRGFEFAVKPYKRSAVIILEEGPWWAFAVRSAVCRISAWLPEWRIPFLPPSGLIAEDGTTTREYTCYETVWGVFFEYVAEPVEEWVERHLRFSVLDVNYDQYKALAREWPKK